MQVLFFASAILILSASPIASAKTLTCDSVFNSGAEFLHSKNRFLHTARSVEVVAKRGRLQGAKLVRPREKIQNWLTFLERTLAKAAKDPAALARLKRLAHDEYVIDIQDIPEAYFEHQTRIARERGMGNIEMTPSRRRELAETLIGDQRSTLDVWIDYLTSPDASQYPTWAKYWAFTEMVRLSRFNQETRTFGGRDRSTVAPFPELNREALALVMDAIVKKVNRTSLDEIKDPHFLNLLDGASFGKLYGHELSLVRERMVRAEQQRGTVEGRWIKYPRGSTYLPLVKSLEGQGTGWCTSAPSTASAQLASGDFYVFYSLNELGNPTVPRIGIRMEGERIAEVRGVATDQNLDKAIASSDVLSQKLQEFGDEGNRYKTRSQSMQKLTELESKLKNGFQLDTSELRFLYEIDQEIEGFGYAKDPRIQELIQNRNHRKDLAEILDIEPSKISLTAEEAFKGGIEIHYGSLEVTQNSPVVLPRRVLGSLTIRATSVDGFVLPVRVNGGLRFAELVSGTDMTLPKFVGGSVTFDKLKFARGIVMPKTVGGDVVASELESADGIAFPDRVDGSLVLRRLNSLEGLTLPGYIGANIDLANLKFAAGLVLPEGFNGLLNLGRLENASGLVLPEGFRGQVALSTLRSAEGLKLPRSAPMTIDLYWIDSLRGIEWPPDIKKITVRKDQRRLQEVPEAIRSKIYLKYIPGHSSYYD